MTPPTPSSWSKLLATLPVGSHYAIHLGLVLVQWTISLSFLAIGIGFFAIFVAELIGLQNLGPMPAIRGIGEPVILSLGDSMGVNHPLLKMVFPFLIGTAALLMRIIIFAPLSDLVKETAAFIAARTKSAPQHRPAPQHLQDTEKTKKARQMVLQNLSVAHGKTDAIQFAVGAPDSERQRNDLLKRFHAIEQALKTATRKNCTFLSADVVGSTRMKVGQKEIDIKSSFFAYEQMLKQIFGDYRAWKEAWTPDGVMICFLDRELAVGAARRLLENLEQFNRNYNKMPEPFRVRCGINEGELAIYEDSELERVADFVIDVAGHMQKEADADSLFLGEHIWKKLEDKTGFKPAGRAVDGFQAYEWRVR